MRHDSVIADLPGGTTFYFVRHGATAANATNVRCGGDVDLPLLPIGVTQAHAVAATIRARALPIPLVISSSLMRARQTAEIVSAALGDLPIVLEPLFDERRLGTLNGASVPMTESLLAAEPAPPSVEPLQAFEERVSQAFSQHGHAFAHGALLVSSRGVARMISRLLNVVEHMPVGNGELIEYRLELGRHTCRLLV